MPEITTDTPVDQFTIAGKTFNVYQPYTEGHPLTANEAASMNQTFAENIRNNFAGRVKELVEAGTFDQDTVQSQLNDYMDEYEFGQRRGGGRAPADPVEAKALEIAKDKVRAALKEAGHNLANVPASEVTRLAKEALQNPANGDPIRAAAKAIVEAAAGLTLDLGSPSVTEQAPKQKAKKAEAEPAAAE